MIIAEKIPDQKMKISKPPFIAVPYAIGGGR
jgi:hypothetical protein